MDYDRSAFIIIEDIVFYDNDLKDTDKMLYGCIRSLSYGSRGCCFASNECLAKARGVSVLSVKKSLKNLEDKGYIKTELFYKENSKEAAERIIKTFTMSDVFNCKTLYKDTGNTELSPHQLKLELHNDAEAGKHKKEKEKEEAERLLEFDKFWEAYPRKIDKARARKKYMLVLKNKSAEADALLEGAKRYRAYVENNRKEEAFIKHASTWLNNRCWENEYAASPLEDKKERELPQWLQGKKLSEMTADEREIYYSIFDFS